MPNTDARVGWIDIAKGVGILLVIAGHTFWLGWSWPVYSFHLPLFFFISGILAHRKDIVSIPIFLSRKARAIITPWFVAVLASAVVCWFVPEWRSGFHIGRIARDFYSANLNCIQNSSLWYLPCLLATIGIFSVFVLIWRLNRLMGVAMLICAIVLSMSLPRLLPLLCFLLGSRLPLKIDTAILGFCFFAVGWLLMEKPLPAVARVWCSGGVALLLATAGWAFGAWTNGWVNMNSLEYGKYPILYMPVAFCGIFAMCLICRFLPCDSVCGKVLSFYGKNTLIIFCSQSLFIRAYLLTASNISGEKFVLYGRNPLGHQILSFVIVAFVLSPLLVAFKCAFVRMSERLLERI